MRLPSRPTAAFTLLELSIVVAVLGLLLAAAMRYAAVNTAINNTATLNATLDTIDNALMNFRMANGRLPCPADVTIAEGKTTGTFGNEVDSLGDGACTGYNFVNSKDPDGPSGNCSGIAPSWSAGVCNAGAPDPLYDSTTLNKVVIGAVPTQALRLADRYAYDPWGRKIWYAVDIRMTASSAFTTYSVSSSIGGIAIKKTVTDTLSNAVAINGVYALISAGPDGHGAYARNINSSGASSKYVFGSTNVDELTNCHCDSNAATATNYFSRIFVQKSRTSDATTITNMFDDTVRYKTRAGMATPAELQ